VRDFGRLRGVTQGESPLWALTEEQRCSRAKDPPLLLLSEKTNLSAQTNNSSPPPLRVFVRWLLGFHRFFLSNTMDQAGRADAIKRHLKLWKRKLSY